MLDVMCDTYLDNFHAHGPNGYRFENKLLRDFAVFMREKLTRAEYSAMCSVFRRGSLPAGDSVRRWLREGDVFALGLSTDVVAQRCELFLEDLQLIPSLRPPTHWSCSSPETVPHLQGRSLTARK